jgi:hypothetical protein
MRSSGPKKQQPMDGDLTMRQATAARLAGRLPGLEVNWKFGHASFETDDGKVFCFINRDGDLAMKLPAGRIELLVSEGHAVPLRMGKRTMREWVVVPVSESSETLQLLKSARVWVESLPKDARPRKPAAKKSVKKS